MLDDLAERARVAYLVEFDHCIAEKNDFRLLCIRYLASRGWRWFGEELDPGIGHRLDTYLTGGDEALLEPVVEDPWYTSGILAAPGVQGDDIAMQTDRARLMRNVRAVVPSARWFGFDVCGDDKEYLDAANAATTYPDLASAMAIREQLIHVRVAAFMREHPGEKVALMAGATHLAKDDGGIDAPGVTGPGGGMVHSIGHHVAHTLADGPVLSIWFLHGQGASSNPFLPPPKALKPARGTLNAELLKRVGRPCLLRVDDDHQRRSITQMHNAVLTCRLGEQVDAVVFAPDVTPQRA